MNRLEVLSMFRSPARLVREESFLHICKKHPTKVYQRIAAAFNGDTTVVLSIRVFYFRN